MTTGYIILLCIILVVIAGICATVYSSWILGIIAIVGTIALFSYIDKYGETDS